MTTDPISPGCRFKLFTHMDDDRSGKVTYQEFAELCREELEMSKKKVPDLQLQGAWNALDDDDTGFITAGEFGPFMKLGAPDKGPGWKEKLAEKRAAEGAAARAEAAAYGGKEVFGDVPAASAEELVALSKLMNGRLQDPEIFPDPAARDWCVLPPTCFARPDSLACACRCGLSLS